MGKIIYRNQPCFSCKSHDALQVYEDGGAKCFSCGKAFNYEKEYKKKHGDVTITPQQDNYRRSHYKKEISLDDIFILPSRGISERLITKKISEFFNVKVSYDEGGEIDRYYFPFSNLDGTATVG